MGQVSYCKDNVRYSKHQIWHIYIYFNGRHIFVIKRNVIEIELIISICQYIKVIDYYMYINQPNSRYKNIVIYNKGISFTNNDQVFGRVDAITVDTTLGCNEPEPYSAGSFITLVKDGMLLLALHQHLNLNVTSHSRVNMFQILIWFADFVLHWFFIRPLHFITQNQRDWLLICMLFTKVYLQAVWPSTGTYYCN